MLNEALSRITFFNQVPERPGSSGTLNRQLAMVATSILRKGRPWLEMHDCHLSTLKVVDFGLGSDCCHRAFRILLSFTCPVYLCT
jgi:hypothetical protein